MSGNEEIVLVRQAVRQCFGELVFSLVDQAKMLTAAAELVRNAVDYAWRRRVHLWPSTNDGETQCGRAAIVVTAAGSKVAFGIEQATPPA